MVPQTAWQCGAIVRVHKVALNVACSAALVVLSLSHYPQRPQGRRRNKAAQAEGAQGVRMRIHAASQQIAAHAVTAGAGQLSSSRKPMLGWHFQEALQLLLPV